MKRLKESIPSNTLKIIELYNKIDSELLEVKPNFQRKLVWKRQHKINFIETVLKNYPFPEIYIASSEIDTITLQATEIVVDGQQRLTTIVDYIKGRGDFSCDSRIPKFNDLSDEDKKSFLNYPVSVKDLKDIGEGVVKEIFQRINSTDYSLNKNERQNAMYGDSDFLLLSKMLVDSEFVVDSDLTEVNVDDDSRKMISGFFHSNSIFSDNDVRRMFDSQFMMLILSTIIDGEYSGRSSKIGVYIDKFNDGFKGYLDIVEGLVEVVFFVKELDLNPQGYWFNKANIFTLFIELCKYDIKSIDAKKMALNLFELERKFDAYFSEDPEIKVSDDEQKYFEYSRQGSHEKQARQHRGRVIKNLMDNSLLKSEEIKVQTNVDYLDEKKISYALLSPTATGIAKSILDAVKPVREFLSNEDIHDYGNQEKGEAHKKIKDLLMWPKNEVIKASFYRSNGRGDYRLSIKGLKKFAVDGDIIALLFIGDSLRVANISKESVSGIEDLK